MLINANKPHLWKADVTQSVYQFNAWFMKFAPVEYRNTRYATTKYVKNALLHTQDLTALTPATLKSHPNVLPTLRMATAPPLARDRLIGLAGVNSSLVQAMEKDKLPKRINATELDRQLGRICEIISEVLDRDIFAWLDEGRDASDREREQASMIVADRLCGSMADPIIRNAHEKR